MSTFRPTPKMTRSWTSYVIALFFTAAALNIAVVPRGRAAVAKDTAAHATAGMDHNVIAANAVSVGDVETVQMSIGAYDRAPGLAQSR